jgi:redox-sensitive bicupin YhaK (pirin superfamily)
MITLRKSQERGYVDHGWLKSFHSFSFGDYMDPRHMGWGNLRVINEDRIAPGTGFGTHGHRDMDILSYVIEGALAHRDDMGNGAAILPGDVQRMTAGRGVRHSEFNHSATNTTHFLQIWILPNRPQIDPGYEQKHFPPDSKRGRLRLVASPDGREDSVRLNADASLLAGLFDEGESAELALDPRRKACVHLVKGALTVNGLSLQGGDAALLAGETVLRIDGGTAAEVLVFDLAA